MDRDDFEMDRNKIKKQIEVTTATDLPEELDRPVNIVVIIKLLVITVFILLNRGVCNYHDTMD